MLKYTLSLRWLRWILLALYLGLVLSLFGLVFFNGGEALVVAALALTFGSQAFFLFGSGRLELSRPVRGWRLVMPAVVAATMLAILIGGAGLALIELSNLQYNDQTLYLLLAGVPLSWLVWTLLLVIYFQGWERFTLIGRLTALVFAGSLAAFLFSVPAHIVVSRRPGCLVGLYTAAGIASGIYVMLWSFGPAIMLLFCQEKRRFELRESRRHNGDAAPESRELLDPPQ